MFGGIKMDRTFKRIYISLECIIQSFSTARVAFSEGYEGDIVTVQ